MADTVREDCLKALRAKFEAMQDGQPVADPYSVTWSLVTRRPIKQLAKGKRYALGIYDQEETKRDATLPKVECTLRVVLEFHVYVAKEQDASEELNRVLGEVERMVRSDIYLGGKVVKMQVTGSEINIDEQYDSQVSGAVFMTMTYRHHHDDPRRRV